MNEPIRQDTLLTPEQLEQLSYEIRLLSGCTTSRLDDAAIELQTDLEMWSYDRRKDRTAPGYFDAYAEFVAMAAADGLDFSDVEDSALIGMPEWQVRLACAWNFVGIAKRLIDPAALAYGWTRENVEQTVFVYVMSARMLVEDALGRSPWSKRRAS